MLIQKTIYKQKGCKDVRDKQLNILIQVILL